MFMNNQCEAPYPLPIFLRITGKRAVVVGGGAVAQRKVRDLVEAGASVTVIAEEPCDDIARLSENGSIELIARRYKAGDTAGAFIVFAATDDPVVNGQVFKEADEAGILINAVDQPSLCNFFSAAVVKRGPLRIAVSTSGCCPALAKVIRCELEASYPETWTAFTEAAGEWRRTILSMKNAGEEGRRAALDKLGERDTFILFRDHGKDRVWDELKRIIFSS